VTAATQERLASLWLEKYSTTRDYIARALRDYELAEDLAVQAFMQLGQKMEAGQAPDPAGLLNTITHGLVVDVRRKRINGPEVYSLDEELRKDDAWASAISYDPPENTFTSDFDRAVRALPEEDRDAFLLSDVRGLLDEEVSEVLDVPLRTVQRRLSRARAAMRKELAA